MNQSQLIQGDVWTETAQTDENPGWPRSNRLVRVFSRFARRQKSSKPKLTMADLDEKLTKIALTMMR